MISRLCCQTAVLVVITGAVILCSPALADNATSSAAQMTRAAQAFLGSLDPGQREAAVAPLDSEKRSHWSNFPVVMHPPTGVLIGDLSDEQKVRAHELLRSALSSQGYGKVRGILLIEDLLYEMEQEALQTQPDSPDREFRARFAETFDSGNYGMAIYGEPGAGDWGFKLDGHHLAINFTVSDGHVGFTPTFVGSNPRVVESGRYAGWMALPHEGARGIELMQSLSKRQQEKATVADVVAVDVFEGPGRRASLEGYEGIEAAAFDETQMRLLHLLIAEYLANMDADAAAAQLAAIEEAGRDSLYFSWRGPVDADGLFYYRVHGPRILIEYNRQDENHDHMIVRDPANDYGEDWLELHYEEHHPTLSEALDGARQRMGLHDGTD